MIKRLTALLLTATPLIAEDAEGQPFPKAVEVQMLELEWPKLNPDKDGTSRTDDYVHGEMWGIFGLETTPDNPRGYRSRSIEKHCKPHGEWNTYDIVSVDGGIATARLGSNAIPAK